MISKFQVSASILSLEQPLIICAVSFNLILQQDSYDLHPTNGSLPQTLRHSVFASSFKAALMMHLLNNYLYLLLFSTAVPIAFFVVFVFVCLFCVTQWPLAPLPLYIDTYIFIGRLLFGGQSNKQVSEVSQR